MSKKRCTFVEFIDANEDLVEQYEVAVGEDLWSLPIKDVEEKISEIAYKLKVGFSTVLNNCINMAIHECTPLMDVLDNLTSTKDVTLKPNNSLQKYFQEINKIYTENNNAYDIPFCEENRDKLISMNLKSVIAIAKCYQGLGIEFEDLISAGNEGLCHAFKKYDPKRACLKDNLLKAVDDFVDETSEPDHISFDKLSILFNQILTYGKAIRTSFEKSFKPGNTYTKDKIRSWIETHITNAKFNSVACKWITAFIIHEINENSRMVRKPKTEIDKDKVENGSYKKEVLVNIDAPVTKESKNTYADLLTSENETADKESYENEENYKIFKQNLNILLTGVKSRDRRILLKKFGIGTIRPLQPNEIAIQENLSVARISQIIGSTIEEMVKNAKIYNVNYEEIFEALRKMV